MSEQERERAEYPSRETVLERSCSWRASSSSSEAPTLPKVFTKTLCWRVS